MPTYESFHEMPAALRRDLADWLLALADSKRVLGLRYAEWCTGAPELEADVAISAMAQYELGHARLLRGVLNDLPERPRDEAGDADPAAWRNLPALDRPARAWDQVVVLNGLVDGLLTINLEAASRGAVRPLAQRLRKALSEEHYHGLHARAWFERLLTGPEEAAARLRRGVEAVLPGCLAWFGPGADNALDRLAAGDVLEVGAAGLRDRFLDEVEALGDGKLELPARRTAAGWEMTETPDWDGWDPGARRHGAPSFDEDTFALLSGAYARAVGVRD